MNTKRPYDKIVVYIIKDRTKKKNVYKLVAKAYSGGFIVSNQQLLPIVVDDIEHPTENEVISEVELTCSYIIGERAKDFDYIYVM